MIQSDGGSMRDGLKSEAPMNIRGFFCRGSLAIALLAASFWIAPGALAHSHVSVGIGIAAPGFGVSVGNCWRCGYWAPPAYYAPPPPVYYAPAYPAPVYYPGPVYYAPRPAYYLGYGYYAPRHHHYYQGGHYRDRGWHHRRGGYYHHRHH
jgi:hypothetical protein